jgi:hypothetical protein
MGILDDAIREHLELKRKHGASEEDLRRQEEEALGPARRDVPTQGDESSVGNGGQPLEAPETAGEESAEMETESPAAPFDGDPAPPDFAPGADESTRLLEPEPFPEEDAPVIRRASEPVEPLPDPEEPVEAPDFPPEPEEIAPDFSPESEQQDYTPDSEPDALDYPGNSTHDASDFPSEPEDHGMERGAISGGDVDAARARELDEDDVADDEPDSGESGDVLEDTPDFLEETPEHDRLWFEQKPPRDFDFD